MMAWITLVYAVVLILIGVGFKLATGTQSITALIPAFMGVPFVILGLWALAKPGHRKHILHAAMAVAVLVILAVGARIPGLITGEGTAAALASHLLVLVASAGYLALGIRSFIAARKARAETPEPTT